MNGYTDRYEDCRNIEYISTLYRLQMDRKIDRYIDEGWMDKDIWIDPFHNSLPKSKVLVLWFSVGNYEKSSIKRLGFLEHPVTYFTKYYRSQKMLK